MVLVSRASQCAAVRRNFDKKGLRINFANLIKNCKLTSEETFTYPKIFSIPLTALIF